MSSTEFVKQRLNASLQNICKYIWTDNYVAIVNMKCIAKVNISTTKHQKVLKRTLWQPYSNRKIAGALVFEG